VEWSGSGELRQPNYIIAQPEVRIVTFMENNLIRYMPEVKYGSATRREGGVAPPTRSMCGHQNNLKV
jgi:hypothetical protein